MGADEKQVIVWLKGDPKYNCTYGYVNGIMKYVADAKYIIEEKGQKFLLHTKSHVGYSMKDKYAKAFIDMEAAKADAEQQEAASTTRWLGTQVFKPRSGDSLMNFKYYLWHRNDPENTKTVPSWTEIPESQVPKPPDSRIFPVIRIYVGDPDEEQPIEQKGTSYLNWDGTWIPFKQAVSGVGVEP